MSELAATSELAPAPRAAAQSAAPGGAVLQGVVQNARALAAQPAVAKSLPALGLLGLAGLAAMIWMIFSAAPERTLFAGLADEEKAAIVDSLRSAGIKHRIDRTTGAIAVSEDDYHQARMLLASQGLPRGGASGGEVIDNLPLGASRAVETERLRGARELDLARTIEGIDAVQTARVHLALETPSVFIRNRAEPAASVMLNVVAGRSLSDAQVQAIVHLVASSVPGLSPDGVSVVDQNGRLLSREGSSGASGASERQIAIQSAIEERYRRAIATLLTPILGAGNFTAEVHADMDFSEVHSTREDYPENARVLRAEEGAVTSDGAAPQPAVGIPGTLANAPPPAAEVAAEPEGAMTPTVPGADAQAVAGGRRTENYTRSFALGREVSVTRQETGTVKRLTVAVALRNPDGAATRSQEDVQALEALVKGAVGFDGARGDSVAISSREFAAVEAAEDSWWQAGWVSLLARNLTALALAALVIFGVARPLVRKGTAYLAQRAESTRVARSQVRGEIAAAIAGETGAESAARITLEMIESAKNYEARATLIRNFVRQDPARAALVVRDLIRADAGNGAERNG